MRIWLKDSERRPDPPAVQTDDRKAVLAGIVVWIVALAVLLVLLNPLLAAGRGWWLWTCVAGLGLGVAGLLFTHSRQK